MHLLTEATPLGESFLTAFMEKTPAGSSVAGPMVHLSIQLTYLLKNLSFCFPSRNARKLKVRSCLRKYCICTVITISKLFDFSDILAFYLVIAFFSKNITIDIIISIIEWSKVRIPLTIVPFKNSRLLFSILYLSFIGRQCYTVWFSTLQKGLFDRCQYVQPYI